MSILTEILAVLLILDPNNFHTSNKVETSLKTELMCLSKVVYHEARGEPLEGKKAVAHVVMNRVNDKRWPNTVCKVVYQRGQFSHFNKRKRFDNTSQHWMEIAELVIPIYLGLEKDNTGNAVYFNNPRISKSKWFFRKLTKTKDIGKHRFYRS